MGGCPVINVPGRTFPVTPYFLEDAVEFSGYSLSVDSDSPYVQRFKKQRTVLQDTPSSDTEEDQGAHSLFQAGYSKDTQATLEAMNEHLINFDLIIALLETICFSNPDLQTFSSAILVFMPSLETIRKLVDLLEGHPAFGTTDFVVYPLHSSISNEQQGRVFSVGSSLGVLTCTQIRTDSSSRSSQDCHFDQHRRDGCHYPRHYGCHRFRQA